MTKAILFISLLIVSNFGFSQSLNLGFLFKPGITTGGEYTTHSLINDTSKFQVNKFRTQLTLPLKTKIGIDFKKLNLKASQTFLTFNTSIRNPNFLNSRTFVGQNIYTASAGITSLTAGLRNGLWVYSANVYISESVKTIKEKPQLNSLGYVAKVKLNNLKFIYFYGLSVVYNFGRFIPVPIGGFTTKLSRKIRLTAILPVQVKLAYKIKKGQRLEFGSTLSGFNAVYRDVNNSLLNYRQIKTHLIYNIKIVKQFEVSAEAGFSAIKSLSFREGKNTLYKFNVKPTPYGGLTLNYTFGKSLFGLKLEGID